LKERTLKLKAAGIARKEAIGLGLNKYFSLSHCPNGHVGERYTRSGACVICAKAKTTAKVASGYFKSHYQNNSERILAKQSEYAKPRLALISERAAKWSKLNPEKRTAISNSYKSRRRAIEDNGISGSMLLAWASMQPKVCFYCGDDCAKKYHVDHFFPLSKGGAHVLTNLRIACAACNLHKSQTLPDKWIEKNLRVCPEMLGGTP
jgi:5-methylcytosine-specific restriction endonuclease McrA